MLKSHWLTKHIRVATYMQPQMSITATRNSGKLIIDGILKKIIKQQFKDVSLKI